MSCNLERSINVGFLSSVIISTLTYFNVPGVSQLNNTKILFLFVVFFVISTSMDHFNYCFTKCKNIQSSLTYGIFTVSLMYLFFYLFVGTIDINNQVLMSIGGNIIFLTLLHYFLCDIRNKYQN